ncbi:MAG: U32 family peptidase [Deltaproteobacteria bacterium]|nr:U32 family peptidase [Deltaproteobacteria bacterium]
MKAGEPVKTPALLAPAGNGESFAAAVESGADAVYLGLKLLSARTSATNFSLDELAFLIPYAHKRGVSVYVALNSLVTAVEIPSLLNLLQSLADLGVDGLIAQDPGVFYLARRFFKELPLHASTLMTVHNHAGVNQLARMGVARVVLARELTLEEIATITARSQVEVEVFVHGALCYSFSGLCLASSFRGGHSGLQGRCVQPCRLRFRQGRREGFFLSCSDFCGLPFLPRIKKMGVAAVKIEGRMKPADYIAQVVKAYRRVLDAEEKDGDAALDEAREMLSRTFSRRLTSGFLGPDPSSRVLSPHRSGSSGLWVGTVKNVTEGKLEVSLRHPLAPGDRLRPETLEGREKRGMTVAGIHSRRGEPLPEGKAGETVLITGRGDCVPGDRLFKVAAKSATAGNVWRKIKGEVSDPLPYRKTFRDCAEVLDELIRPSQVSPGEQPEVVILKVSRVVDLLEALRSEFHRVYLTATRLNLEAMSRKNLPAKMLRRIGWSLPAIIPEKSVEYWRAALGWYSKKGWKAWEVNNWGHLDLLAGEQALELMAGCRLNVRNHAAVREAACWGCASVVFSLEITKIELEHFAAHPPVLDPIIAVYAWPALFTSRLQPSLREEKPFFSQRKEAYHYCRQGDLATIYADSPMNWFGKLHELRAMGYRRFLLDIADGPAGLPPNPSTLLRGYQRAGADEPYSLFNYERNP